MRRAQRGQASGSLGSLVNEVHAVPLHVEPQLSLVLAISAATGAWATTVTSKSKSGPRPLELPHPSRLAPDHPDRERILAAHAAALAADQVGYPDPQTGLFVLTAGFLARRGTCCGQGCRHCPYVDDGPAAPVEPIDGAAGG